LKLKYDEPLSNFAFNFNLRPYTAARAMWTAVHLGGRPAQDVMVGSKLYSEVLGAMSVHPDDASVLEAACGCLLAGALGNEAGRARRYIFSWHLSIFLRYYQMR